MSKNTALRVTDVNFRKFVKGNICGYATIEFNKVLKVNGFKIMHGKDGFFVAMPAHRADDDEWYSDVFISDEEMRLKVHFILYLLNSPTRRLSAAPPSS